MAVENIFADILGRVHNAVEVLIAAGTLPEAPDMRPSVTNATLNPLLCREASAGVSLCNSGIPLARGPW